MCTNPSFPHLQVQEMPPLLKLDNQAKQQQHRQQREQRQPQLKNIPQKLLLRLLRQSQHRSVSSDLSLPRKNSKLTMPQPQPQQMNRLRAMHPTDPTQHVQNTHIRHGPSPPPQQQQQQQQQKQPQPQQPSHPLEVPAHDDYSGQFKTVDSLSSTPVNTPLSAAMEPFGTGPSLLDLDSSGQDDSAREDQDSFAEGLDGHAVGGDGLECRRCVVVWCGRVGWEVWL